MAVGLVFSGNRYPRQGRSKRGPSSRIRLLSNIGLYPRGNIRGARGTYYIDEQVAFIAVKTDEDRSHAYWSEVTLLAFEEIRFLSAVLLSMRPDFGVLHFYPGGAHITGATSDHHVLYKRAKRLALQDADRGSSNTIPLGSGAPYRVSEQEIDENIYKLLASKISIRDHLMLRGLSAILKADMLQVHPEFGEEATSLLYVALEVAFQLTLRQLRSNGAVNPSALDAGQFLFSNFPNEVPGQRFFEEYYEDRIKTLHPLSRYGAFAFPPLNAGDFYGLRGGLIAVFQFLITGQRWYTLWD